MGNKSAAEPPKSIFDSPAAFSCLRAFIRLGNQGHGDRMLKP